MDHGSGNDLWRSSLDCDYTDEECTVMWSMAMAYPRWTAVLARLAVCS